MEKQEITVQNDIVIIRDDFSNIILDIDDDEPNNTKEKDNNGTTQANSNTTSSIQPGDINSGDSCVNNSTSDKKQTGIEIPEENQTVIRIEDKIGIEDETTGE